MRIRSDERGQVMVLTVLSMAFLMGIMALAIDVGVLFRAKRNLQVVADAAAFAGALDYYYNASNSTAVSTGTAAAVANGVTSSQINVYSPPIGGINAGKAGFVEAIVVQPNNTLFMGVLSGIGSINVAARAVGGSPGVNSACVYIANPTASDAFHVQGSSTLIMPKCGIYVNSDSGTAVKITGNASSFNGTYLDVNGGFTGHDTQPTPITTGVTQSSEIPLNMTGPVPGSPTNGCTPSTLTNITTANVSTLPSGSAICFASAVTIQNGVTMPGSMNGTVYVFQNGVTIPVGATVSFGSGAVGSATNGAVIDLYGGTLNQASNSVLNAYAPTAGTYNTIAIFQPSTNPTSPLQVQFGSNYEVLDGQIYAPGVEVYLQDNGCQYNPPADACLTASGIIAGTMYVKSSSLNITGYSMANPNTTPFKVVTLVE